MALLQSHKDTCAVSLPCATVLHFGMLVTMQNKTDFLKKMDCGTFAEPSRYLCSIFAMVLGGISVNRD